MNPIASTWRQLVQRRLWPVAVLLLAALVAVPFVLAKEPEPIVVPPPPAAEEPTAAEAAATGQPVVALAEEGDRARRRRVLGARKDPFAAAPPPKAKKSNKADQKPADTPAEAPTEPTGGAPATPVTPPVVTPPVEEPKKKTYPADSLIVRFGDAVGGVLDRGVLRKRESLPVTEEPDTQPVVVYLGLTKDGKEAIFLVDASAQVTGDGECKPHPSNCETVHLGKGETEFFDIVDDAGAVVAQYQLDVVDIKTTKKPSAAKARKASRAAARVAAQVDSGL